MTVIYMPKQSNGTVHSSKDLNQLIDYVMNPEKQMTLNMFQVKIF